MTSLKDQVALPLGQIASGCFVLTARDADKSTGILASWVQQAGFDPPALTVAVAKERPIRAMIEKSRQFVINIVDSKQCTVMLKRFGKHSAGDSSVFANVSVQNHAAGVIVDDCLGYLCCELSGSVDAGDHIVYVGRIIGGGQKAPGEPSVHIRTNGFGY